MSDGSYKDTYGTAAWVITSPITSHSLSGQVIVPGSMDTHSSYRSELAGIYSSILISVKLCKFFDIQGGQITLACDSHSALDSVLRNNKCTPVDAPCFDLLGAIHCLCLLQYTMDTVPRQGTPRRASPCTGAVRFGNSKYYNGQIGKGFHAHCPIPSLTLLYLQRTLVNLV